MESDPQKLEEFYQKTRAKQLKAAKEKDVQGGLKVASATIPHRYASFTLTRV